MAEEKAHGKHVVEKAVRETTKDTLGHAMHEGAELAAGGIIAEVASPLIKRVWHHLIGKTAEEDEGKRIHKDAESTFLMVLGKLDPGLQKLYALRFPELKAAQRLELKQAIYNLCQNGEEAGLNLDQGAKVLQLFLESAPDNTDVAGWMRIRFGANIGLFQRKRSSYAHEKLEHTAKVIAHEVRSTANRILDHGLANLANRGRARYRRSPTTIPAMFWKRVRNFFSFKTLAKAMEKGL